MHTQHLHTYDMCVEKCVVDPFGCHTTSKLILAAWGIDHVPNLVGYRTDMNLRIARDPSVSTIVVFPCRKIPDKVSVNDSQSWDPSVPPIVAFPGG